MVSDPREERPPASRRRLDSRASGPVKMGDGPAARGAPPHPAVRGAPGLGPFLRPLPRPPAGPRAAAAGAPRRRALRVPLLVLRRLGGQAEAHRHASGLARLSRPFNTEAAENNQGV